VTAPFSPAAGDLLRQRRTLRRHRAMASGLLVGMGGLYGLSHWLGADGGLWLGLLRAGSEAALIGGLADWFAVTALFRRPLGLPIPHTALVRRNKDRIGRRIGQFVTENFLAPELVGERIRAAGPARRIGVWLADPGHARAAAAHLAEMIPPLLASLEDSRVRDLVRKTITAQLRGADLAPVLGQVIDAVPEKDFESLLSQAVAFTRTQLARNEDRIFAAVSEKGAWWMPRSIDKRIARALIEALHDFLDDLATPDDPTRAQFIAAMRDLRARLQTDPDTRARLAGARNRILRHPEVQHQLARMWDRLRAMILDGARTPDSRLRQAIADGLRGIGRQLADDPALQRIVDAQAERLVVAGLVPWRAEIGAFIEDVVRRWDADTVSERVELAVGKDLQYIRVNGTLVGALVGCLLHLIVTAVDGGLP